MWLCIYSPFGPRTKFNLDPHWISASMYVCRNDSYQDSRRPKCNAGNSCSSLSRAVQPAKRLIAHLSSCLSSIEVHTHQNRACRNLFLHQLTIKLWTLILEMDTLAALQSRKKSRYYIDLVHKPFLFSDSWKLPSLQSLWNEQIKILTHASASCWPLHSRLHYSRAVAKPSC